MLTVAPDDVLEVGSTATITVTGSSHGGQTITVNIDDGEGHTDTVEIQLNDAGEGSADWTVPAWALAKFNYSTCDEVARSIGDPAPSDAQGTPCSTTRDPRS